MGSSNGYSDDYNNGQYDNNSNQYDNYDDNTNTGNYNKVPHYSSVSASSSLQSNGGPVVFKTEQSVTSNKAKAKYVLPRILNSQVDLIKNIHFLL